MKIFEPIDINGMHLKNRIGMPPFLNMPAGNDFFTNDYTVKWFESRAKGGAGLVMTGTVMPIAPPPQSLNVLGVQGIGIYDDKFIPGFSKIARAVHAHGAKFGVQIGMGGLMTGIGPSLPPYPDEKGATDDLFIVLAGFRIPVFEMTVEQIEIAEDAVAQAAARAREAGGECVELH